MSNPLEHHPRRRSDQKSWDFELGVPGFKYGDLNRVRRLESLDRVFRETLRAADPELSEAFEAYRACGGTNLGPVEEADLLVRTAPHLGRFVARLFRIEKPVEDLAARSRAEAKLFEWKKKFLQPRVLKKAPSSADLAGMDLVALELAWQDLAREAGVPHAAPDQELALAEAGLCILQRFARDKDPQDRERLSSLERWCLALAWHPALRARTSAWASFKRPHSLDFDHLVDVLRPASDPLGLTIEGPLETRRARDGFGLTDPRMDQRHVLGEIHYCVYCHEREKDSCSKGFQAAGPIVRIDQGKAGPDAYRKNPLGIPLQGCPLDERISEAHLVKRDGSDLGALAVVMLDNPMCPGTGHRICNDCMKSCVFQKQSPVDIPQIETGILTDVLHLPYGVEIYGLLTRWNPLNARRPFPRAYNGKNVLVVGMGPAGYTLAHYLLQEGFGVVGVDGLKVEPLAPEILGARRRVPRPVHDWDQLKERLDERILLGFGGVSEYGITVRWDKNFLDLIYLTLMRRKKFRLYGGVRFGGTVTLEDAFGDLAFDHVAVAAGAGRPTIVPMKNNLIRGVRKASDFLMGLQLTGAYKANGLANLQVRLPAVVIGGGLTAVDTATELMAYYVVQVEKTLDQLERLAERTGGVEAVFGRMSPEDAPITREFLVHGREVRAEREAAAREGRLPDLPGLVRKWGGVSIVYRKRLQDSPAYRLNHEEVVKALEEGIRFVECLAPVEVLDDGTGTACGVLFERQAESGGKWHGTGEQVRLDARAVLVAAGTHPNSIYERERPGTFQRDRWDFFVPHRAERGPEGVRLAPVDPARGEIGFFTSHREPDGRLVSFYGDSHPVFEGNVVKAMASAKHGSRAVAALFEAEVALHDIEDQPDREKQWVRFAERMDDGFRARVLDVLRLTESIVEVIVRAPFAARHFQPGQFYRLQNFESLAVEVEGFRLTMEGLALTGAWVDKDSGLLSMIVLELGLSTRLCGLLEPGEEVVVMGPTGTPTEIPEGETVLLAGGGLGNAVLFSIAAALKAKGNRVIYFAGYKTERDLFRQIEIEKSTDLVVWSVDIGPPIRARRPQDHSFVGNIVQAMDAYARGVFGEPQIPLAQVTRIISIGSDRMMNAVRIARKSTLAGHLNPDHVAIASINSPMQCMLKEVCAQCLQKHVDPVTGREAGIVFSCFNQDQDLDRVDFENLRQRLGQNSAAERLSALWLDYLSEQRKVSQA